MKSSASPGEGRRMLLAFAHPDDESFGMGATIAYYAQQGVAITLICSTNGDVGTVDERYLENYQSVAEVRLAELACAAETLGIKEVITYGYRDSGMMGTPENNHPDCLWQADEDVVVGRLVGDIRRTRPQVVVTFDPFGGYGHPDHIYMHRATTRAFFAAGDPAQYPEQIEEGLAAYQPAKLYYTVFPRLWLRLRIWDLRLRGQDPRRIGRNKDLDLMAVLEHQLPTHASINVNGYRRPWQQAARCHASQENPRESLRLFERLSSLLDHHQTFSRAYPTPAPHEKREHDLFAGIAV